jgi:hypothetical protein
MGVGFNGRLQCYLINKFIKYFVTDSDSLTLMISKPQVEKWLMQFTLSLFVCYSFATVLNTML